MTATRDTAPLAATVVPSFTDRAALIAALGWPDREAEWIALVALHTGVFLRSQTAVCFGESGGSGRKWTWRFTSALFEKQQASEDNRAIFPGGARAVLLTVKTFYRVLDIPNVRHRRGKGATDAVLLRRLLSLDYLIERPSLTWLATEDDKVQSFEALGISRATLPCRHYGKPDQPQVPRYFDLKMPVAVDPPTATFVYVDAGQTSDSELRSWGQAHMPLWVALRRRTFAVHVVAVGLTADVADRAGPVLTHWTKDAADPAPPAPIGPTQADPEIRRELATLDPALDAASTSRHDPVVVEEFRPKIYGTIEDIVEENRLTAWKLYGSSAKSVGEIPPVDLTGLVPSPWKTRGFPQSHRPDMC